MYYIHNQEKKYDQFIKIIISKNTSKFITFLSNMLKILYLEVILCIA